MQKKSPNTLRFQIPLLPRSGNYLVDMYEDGLLAEEVEDKTSINKEDEYER